jgi:hypothetical protein
MSRTTIIGFDMDIAHEPPAKRLKTQVVGSDISVELDADPVDEVWNESEAVSVEAQIEIPLPEVTLLNEQDRPEPILGSIPYIKVPELCNPPSQYDGWEPPCTLLPEKEALDSILVRGFR